MLTDVYSRCVSRASQGSCIPRSLVLDAALVHHGDIACPYLPSVGSSLHAAAGRGASGNAKATAAHEAGTRLTGEGQSKSCDAGNGSTSSRCGGARASLDGDPAQSTPSGLTIAGSRLLSRLVDHGDERRRGRPVLGNGQADADDTTWMPASAGRCTGTMRTAGQQHAARRCPCRCRHSGRSSCSSTACTAGGQRLQWNGDRCGACRRRGVQPVNGCHTAARTACHASITTASPRWSWRSDRRSWSISRSSAATTPADLSRARPIGSAHTRATRSASGSCALSHERPGPPSCGRMVVLCMRIDELGVHPSLSQLPGLQASSLRAHTWSSNALLPMEPLGRCAEPSAGLQRAEACTTRPCKRRCLLRAARSSLCRHVSGGGWAAIRCRSHDSSSSTGAGSRAAEVWPAEYSIAQSFSQRTLQAIPRGTLGGQPSTAFQATTEQIQEGPSRSTSYQPGERSRQALQCCSTESIHHRRKCAYDCRSAPAGRRSSSATATAIDMHPPPQHDATGYCGHCRTDRCGNLFSWNNDPAPGHDCDDIRGGHYRTSASAPTNWSWGGHRCTAADRPVTHPTSRSTCAATQGAATLSDEGTVKVTSASFLRHSGAVSDAPTSTTCQPCSRSIRNVDSLQSMMSDQKRCSRLVACLHKLKSAPCLWVTLHAGCVGPTVQLVSCPAPVSLLSWLVCQPFDTSLPFGPGRYTSHAARRPSLYPGHCSLCVACVHLSCVLYPCPPRTQSSLLLPLGTLRIGEAKQPGPEMTLTPRRRISVKRPALPDEQTPATLIDSQTTLASLPSIPEADDMGQSGQADLPADPDLADPRRTLKPLLKISGRRSDQNKCLVSCAMIASKSAWRWQVRSKPVLSGGDAATPEAALRIFLRTHSPSLSAETQGALREHLPILQAHVPAFAKWLEAKNLALRPAIAALPPCVSNRAMSQQVDITWDDLHTLASARVSTLRYIPRACIAETQALALDLLSAPTEERVEPTLSDVFLVLPKLILLARPGNQSRVRGKDRQRMVSQKIAQARKGQWSVLLHDALASAGEPGEPLPVLHEDDDSLPDPLASNILRSIQNGRPLGLWKQTRGHGLAPLNHDSIRKAEMKLAPHALPKPRVLPPMETNTWTLTDKQIDKAHEHLQPHKCIDPAGWCHESWTFMAKSTLLKTAMTGWLQRTMVLPECHPLRALLSVHRMVMLAKPDMGVRPILVSMVARKVIHTGVCALIKQDLGEHFHRVQYGIGRTQGAAQLLTSLLSMQMNEGPPPCYARLDISNAFGELPRHKLLHLLQRDCAYSTTSWGPWITSMLATTVHVSTGLKAEEVLLVSEGLPQGDPLSAYLFAYYIADVLLTAQAELPAQVQIGAYMDDVIVASDAAHLEMDLPLIFHHLREAELPPNPQKTSIWASQPVNAEAYPYVANLVTDDDGIMICGHALSSVPEDDMIPLGTQGYVDTWCQKRTMLEQRECRRVLSLLAVNGYPYALQCVMLLYRMLWPSRITHMLRALPCSAVWSLLEPMHDLLVGALCSILQCDSLTASQLAVASLPTRMGGLGFCDLRVHGLVSRLASLVSLAQIPETPLIVDVWVRDEIPELVARLQPHVADDLSSIVSATMTPAEAGSPKTFARRITRLVSSCLSDKLRAELPEVNPSLAWRWRRHGGGLGPHSQQHLCAAWLDASPSSPTTAMETACYRWCLRERVAIANHLPHERCRSAEALTGVPCEQRLDMWGRHALLCNVGEINRRHNRLRNLLATVAKTASMQVLVEQRTSTEVLGATPAASDRAVHTADLHLLCSSGGQLWVDTSIVTCHHQADMASQLSQGERRKLREYGLKPVAAVGVMERLIPCVIDAFGMMSDDAHQLFRHLHQARVQYVVTSHGLTLSVAEKQTRAQLWEAASVLLLRSAWLCSALATHGVALQPPSAGRSEGGSV